MSLASVSYMFVFLTPWDMYLEAWIVMSWWEPCNIKVSPNCLLPDTICDKCLIQIENYYAFVKKSLHSIVILETQFSIQQSCLKSKQKNDKCTYSDFGHKKADKGVQTEDYLDLISGGRFHFEEYCSKFSKTYKRFEDLSKSTKIGFKLVDYDIDSGDSEGLSDCEETTLLHVGSNNLPSSVILNNKVGVGFNSGTENCWKNVPNICKSTSSKRKSKMPKKIDTLLEYESIDENEKTIEASVNVRCENVCSNSIIIQADKPLPALPYQLPCSIQTDISSSVEAHIPDVDGVAEAVSSESEGPYREKTKKKLPNLVKIFDLKKTDSCGLDDKSSQDPPQLLPSFVCSNCPGEFTNKLDLLMHSQLQHSEQAAYLCGLCMQQCTSFANLKNHVEICSSKHKINSRLICKVCKYGDDNIKSLENHIIVHEFLIEECRKQFKMFDPADYVEINESGTNSKNLLCIECGLSDFESLKDFNKHRRNEHSIYHCDLCNKSYGRHSHLWKHVNRHHKGHPSITCQICSRTSASKYHLLEHFNKTHVVKHEKERSEDDMSRNHQTVVEYKTDSLISHTNEEAEKLLPINLIKLETEEEKLEMEEVLDAPKEIDPSHNLYSNIITNYTPPLNEGEFKCLKCSKGFHRKSLLKKHKRNCRPKLQKDLLTRCKSCSRVFKDRQSLAKHLVNYHSDYSCEICNENVQSKCEIISHIRFQHPDCTLICTICKNVLRSNNDLQEHLRNHSDSYICQFCGDNLPSKVKLKMHILSLHRKILSLSCGICLKLFENQLVLKDHVTLLHKDKLIPLLTCPICAKNYGSKWKTFDHINKSHGKVFRACRTCLEVFNNDAQLQAHCDVTSHGPSSGFNTTALRNTIMAMVKCVVEQNPENNNENIDYEKENNTKSSMMQDGNKIMLLEKRLLEKRPSEENTNVPPNKKMKFDLKPEKDTESPQVTSTKRTVYLNSNDPTLCEICFKTWPAKKHLWQHYIRCHKTQAATVCGICLKTNESYESLQKHLKENHPKLLHGQGIGSNFICKICGRYHNASSKLRLHMAIHTNFDWNLFENKHMIIKENPDELEVFKYENLIEQVEYSNSEDDGELDIKLNKEHDFFSEEDINTGSTWCTSEDSEEEEGQ